MKDIIIVAGVIMALTATISVFEAAIAMFKLANALDEISASLKHTNTYISELRYTISDKYREVILGLAGVENAISDTYESMFTNASVTIIRDDHSMYDDERGCCLEPNSK